MNSIHFIPFHGCKLVHLVLYTPFSTNPSPYEPVMWGLIHIFGSYPKHVRTVRMVMIGSLNVEMQRKGHITWIKCRNECFDY